MPIRNFRCDSDSLIVTCGCAVVSTFDHPELVKLGHAALMEEVMIGEAKLTRFSGCAGGAACSIVLRGSSQVCPLSVCAVCFCEAMPLPVKCGCDAFFLFSLSRV